MKTLIAISLGLMILIPGAVPGNAQTFDLQFVELLNTGGELVMKVRIKSNTSTFGMGSSNLVFDFTGGISAPSLTATHNFSGGILYSAMTLTTPGATRVSLNIVYNGSPGFGTTVQAGYMDVAEITFDIVGGGTATFTWRTTAPNPTNVFKDDATQVTAGTLNGYTSTPLPVQIASFTAAVINHQGHVKLDWTTLSETNNYGFEVQKSLNSPNAYEAIPGSFIPGQGTTITPHSYSYTDVTGSPGVWYYRLKQIDLSGPVHYTEGIQPTSLTGFGEKPIPTEIALSQNYPNPFNPSTMIEFALPTQSHVQLEVYNTIGERIATLVDEIRSTGYHAVPFDASGLASGIYFYRFQAEKTLFTRKMMVLK